MYQKATATERGEPESVCSQYYWVTAQVVQWVREIVRCGYYLPPLIRSGEFYNQSKCKPSWCQHDKNSSGMRVNCCHPRPSPSPRWQRNPGDIHSSLTKLTDTFSEVALQGGVRISRVSYGP